MPPQRSVLDTTSNQSSIAYTPEDKDQYIVQTPYGRAMVIRTRRDDKDPNKVLMRELELIDWKAATKGTKSPKQRPATLYSPLDFPSVAPKIGDQLVCLYGRGKVVDVRDDGMVVVQLSSWRLAQRSLVTCYLNASAVHVVRDKRLYEMDVYEKVEHAQELKAQAAQEFASKDYNSALKTYAHAVDAVRYVQHKPDSSNEVRADLVILMITCSNNAATCCLQLTQWDECEKFARNALVLMDALEPKRGGKIHTLLAKEGYSDAKLFGEYKVKSYLLIAKALAEKQYTDEALQVLKQAHEVIAKYTAEEYTQQPSLQPVVNSLLSSGKQVKKLHNTCKERRKEERKKEKQRAQAMFGGSSEEKKEISDAPPSTVTTTMATPAVAPSDSLLTNESESSSSSCLNKPLGKTKKRVSFSEASPQVKEFSTSNDENDDDTLEWYQDPEVMIGLGVFTGIAIGSAWLVSHFFLSKRG